MNKNSTIYIAGHTGMVGSAILRKLTDQGYTNLITRSSAVLNLIDQRKVLKFFKEENIEYVFLAAAKVGGIIANNTYKAEFLYNNLQIQNNVIHSAYLTGVKKLMFLGSSCIYPKLATLPLQEESLFSGPLEATNDAYATAKLAGIKMCTDYRQQYGCNFITVIPTSLYGYNDNYHPQNSHVLPGLIRRFHEAKVARQSSVILWGTGTPKREFLYVDDLADACYYLMLHYDQAEPINVGTGEDKSIKELAMLVREVVGYEGKIELDYSKPDGTMRKVLDVSRMRKTGWQPTIELHTGLQMAYADFLQQHTRVGALK